MKFFNEVKKLKLNENLVKRYKEELSTLLKYMQENTITYPQK
jgi:hypothetical protein